jgi:hypothetical protein
VARSQRQAHKPSPKTCHECDRALSPGGARWTRRVPSRLCTHPRCLQFLPRPPSSELPMAGSNGLPREKPSFCQHVISIWCSAFQLRWRRSRGRTGLSPSPWEGGTSLIFPPCQITPVWEQSRPNLLGMSISWYDPERTLIWGCEVKTSIVRIPSGAPFRADTAAGGDEDIAVLQRVSEVGQAAIGPR